MLNTPKPVTTAGLLGWRDDGTCGISALLVLEDKSIVQTSPVVRIEYRDDGAIREMETKNTIYQLEK